MKSIILPITLTPTPKALGWDDETQPISTFTHASHSCDAIHIPMYLSAYKKYIHIKSQYVSYMPIVYIYVCVWVFVYACARMPYHVSHHGVDQCGFCGARWVRYLGHFLSQVSRTVQGVSSRPLLNSLLPIEEDQLQGHLGDPLTCRNTRAGSLFTLPCWTV